MQYQGSIEPIWIWKYKPKVVAPLPNGVDQIKTGYKNSEISTIK